MFFNPISGRSWPHSTLRSSPDWHLQFRSLLYAAGLTAQQRSTWVHSADGRPGPNNISYKCSRSRSHIWYCICRAWQNPVVLNLLSKKSIMPCHGYTQWRTVILQLTLNLWGLLCRVCRGTWPSQSLRSCQ